MLCVYWVAGDHYDNFVRSQPPEKKLSRESWENLREWTKTTVGLTTPEALDAMLCFMAIHDLGKISTLREIFAPGIFDHDIALGHILDHSPDILPSYLRVGEGQRALVRAAVQVQFNFGQFL